MDIIKSLYQVTGMADRYMGASFGLGASPCAYSGR